MKAFTSLEQSKKLAEFLPLESTDMGWNVFVDGTTRILPINDWDLVKDGSGNVKFYPCWSLAALLDVLPTGKVLLHDKGNRGYKCICNNIDTYYSNNPVDACCEMILKLHEQKLL